MKLNIALSKVEPEIRSKLYTPEQAAAVPQFSLQVAESVYAVPSKTGNIVIDNKHGLGETPDGRNALYKGFMGIVSVKKIIDSIFPDMQHREKDSLEMLQLIQQGYSIAQPMIHLNIDPFVDQTQGHAKISGHEGRARVWALHQLGVKEIPVACIFLGYRARHVKDRIEFINWIMSGVENEKHVVVKNMFNAVLFA